MVALLRLRFFTFVSLALRENQSESLLCNRPTNRVVAIYQEVILNDTQSHYAVFLFSEKEYNG